MLVALLAVSIQADDVFQTLPSNCSTTAVDYSFFCANQAVNSSAPCGLNVVRGSINASLVDGDVAIRFENTGDTARATLSSLSISTNDTCMWSLGTTGTISDQNTEIEFDSTTSAFVGFMGYGTESANTGVITTRGQVGGGGELATGHNIGPNDWWQFKTSFNEDFNNFSFFLNGTFINDMHSFAQQNFNTEIDIMNWNGGFNSVDYYGFMVCWDTQAHGVTCPQSAPVANNPPTHSTPFLNTTDDPLNTTSANLTVFNRSTADIDGDVVKNVVDWILFGSSITLLNMPFEGGSNSTFTKDYSLNSNDGVVSGATFSSSSGFDGRGAYSFDGVNDEITGTLSSVIGLNDYSLTTWFKSSHDTSASEFIWGNNGAGTSTETDLFLTNTGQLRSRINGTTVITDSGFDDLDWHYVAFTFDRNGFAQGYIDGVVSGSAIDISATTSDITTSTWNIGSRDSGNFFNGSIDSFAVYNRSLSSEQVLALFENRTDLIVSQETVVGDVWSACITPNDGSIDGVELCSNNVLINDDFSVTILFPENNDAFNSSQINISFVTTGFTSSCDLLENSSGSFVVVDSNASVSTGVNTTLVDNVTDIVVTTDILYVVNCSAGGFSVSDSVLVSVDRDTPNITISTPLSGTVFNATFDFNINCTDPNLFEFEGQIVSGNGSGVVVQSFSFLNISGTSISFNDTFAPTFEDNYRLSVNCSDGHTDNDISSLYSSIDGNDVAYTDGSSWLTETWRGSTIAASVRTKRLGDRIITINEFDRALMTGSQSITKRVFCSEPFKRVPYSAYTGHVVCGGMWWDADTTASTTISWIDPYTFDITFTSTTATFETQSVGIINTNSQTTFFSFDNETPVVTLITVNATTFGFGNNDIVFNASDSLSINNCQLLEDRDGDGLFEKVTVKNNIVNDAVSSIVAVLPNVNTSFEYKVVCFDNANNRGESVVQTLFIRPTKPYSLALPVFLSDDFDLSTTGGTLFFIILLLLLVGIIVYAEITRIPMLFFVASMASFFFNLIVWYRVSTVFGSLLMLITFSLLVRMFLIGKEFGGNKNG